MRKYTPSTLQAGYAALMMALSGMSDATRTATSTMRRIGKRLKRITPRRYTNRIKGLQGVPRTGYDRLLASRAVANYQ